MTSVCYTNFCNQKLYLTEWIHSTEIKTNSHSTTFWTKLKAGRMNLYVTQLHTKQSQILFASDYRCHWIGMPIANVARPHSECTIYYPVYPLIVLKLKLHSSTHLFTIQNSKCYKSSSKLSSTHRPMGVKKMDTQKFHILFYRFVLPIINILM